MTVINVGKERLCGNYYDGYQCETDIAISSHNRIVHITAVDMGPAGINRVIGIIESIENEMNDLELCRAISELSCGDFIDCGYGIIA